MTAFFRTWTFWIALGSWAVLVGGHYAAIVPSPYGLVLANVVAMVYAATRCLQKRKAGIPWKGILLTSEFAFSAITVLLNFCESLTRLPGLSPRALAAISALVVGLGSLMHTLSSSKGALPTVEAIINDLAKNNPVLPANGAPTKVLTEATTPVVPRQIATETTEQNIVPVPVNWAEYALSDDKGNVIGNFCMIPSWSDTEILSFLTKRGLVAHPEECSIRVLQKDEKGKKVFQSIDSAGKTLTFVFQKDMGQWRPQ